MAFKIWVPSGNLAAYFFRVKIIPELFLPSKYFLSAMVKVELSASDSETFKNSYLRGQKSQKHVPIEKKRIAYVTIYLHNHEQHKCGLYFLRMRDWLKRGQEYGIINSKCSNSWISDNLRCDNKNLVCTQKGVNGDTKEEEAESMGTPGAEFHTFIEDKIINSVCLQCTVDIYLLPNGTKHFVHQQISNEKK